MIRSLFAGAVFVAASNIARAQPVVDPDEVEVTAAVDVNLSKDRVAKPVTFGFDFFYGAAPDIDVGAVMTSSERTGFLADADGGVCVGDETSCPSFFDRPGVLGRYQLARGELSALVEAGVMVVSLSDPFAVSAKLGFRARTQGGDFFIAVAPNIFVGLSGRTIVVDPGVDVDFNTERVSLPIDLGLALDDITFFLQLGVAAPLDNFVDGLNTPLGAGARFAASKQIDVLLWFSMRNLINTSPDVELVTDFRSAGISATYRP